MKFVLHRIILFCSIVISFSLNSQITGTKFAPDSTYWKEQGDWWQSMSSHPYIYHFNYLLGDTIIGNKFYQKVYSMTRNSNVFDTVCLGSLKLLHYNNRTLFVNDIKIYDFNKTVGDTENIYLPWTTNHPAGYFTFTVNIVDSAFIGNKWRRQLTYSFVPGVNISLKRVEGIGDINYGLAPNYGTIETYKMLGGNYKLNCFSEHFQNTYGTGCGVNSICGSVIPTSKMACNSYSSNVTFSIYSGTPPYSFTIEPPPLCASSYTSISTSSIAVTSLSCAGVYTFHISDSNNMNIGSITHTVSLDTVINVPVNSLTDTICDNQTITLNITAANPNFSINPINWSNGGNGPSITVAPNITTTYSVTGLYTTVSSRTCTAKGSKKINVKNCIGIEELYLHEMITVYPNPSSNLIYINNLSNILINEISIITVEGKKIKTELQNQKIIIPDIAEGLYYIQIVTEKGRLFKKIIIQRD